MSSNSDTDPFFSIKGPEKPSIVVQAILNQGDFQAPVGSKPICLASAFRDFLDDNGVATPILFVKRPCGTHHMLKRHRLLPLLAVLVAFSRPVNFPRLSSPSRFVVNMERGC